MSNLELSEYLATQTEVDIYDFEPTDSRVVRKALSKLSKSRKAIFIKSKKGKGLYVRIDHELCKENVTRECDKGEISMSLYTKREEMKMDRCFFNGFVSGSIITLLVLGFILHFLLGVI